MWNGACLEAHTLALKKKFLSIFFQIHQIPFWNGFEMQFFVCLKWLFIFNAIKHNKYKLEIVASTIHQKKFKQA